MKGLGPIELASDHNTPADELRRLAGNHDREVRQRVALNPNTPSDALLLLASDPDLAVSRSLVFNRNFNDEMAKIIRDRGNWILLFHLLDSPWANQKIRDEIEREFLKSFNRYLARIGHAPMVNFSMVDARHHLIEWQLSCRRELP